MGAYLSRNSGEVQEVDISSTNAYRYPPKTGNFFASHFIMGGQKFETMQPEAYLFGENSDLNFLGPKPYNAPYRVASSNQPVKALRCYVNIRKDSLRLVKVPSSLGKNTKNDVENEEQDRQITTNEGDGPFLYNIEFTFDADTPSSVTIYYNATEVMLNKNVIYSPEHARDFSDTVHFSSGCNQQFCLPSHCIDPSKLATTTVDWTKGYTRIPIVIQICADCGPTVVGHSHITYAEFYKPSDNSWSIRTVKQKQAIEGVCYLIQEIFGIENKNAAKEDGDGDDDDDSEDDSSDCVVCLSEMRDTLILPCKHLCLCSTCANQLRYQQSGCPICRQSFRALLQIRAVRKKTSDSPAVVRNARSDDADSENEEEEVEFVQPVPPGYEVVPLIEAVRGNVTSSPRDQDAGETSTHSASLDEVRVVDETSEAPSTSSTSRHFVAENKADATDSSDGEGSTQVACVVYNDPKAPYDNAEQSTTDDESQMYEEVSTHPYSEVRLPGLAESDAGTETTESQNSAKELLPDETKAIENVQNVEEDSDRIQTTKAMEV